LTYIHASAEVSNQARVGSGASIWRFSIIQDGAEIGSNTIIGSNVYIGSGVKIGSDCKIQNGAQIFEGSIVGDGVFIGPGVILTNDKKPRAVTDQNKLKSKSDWKLASVQICNFASIGAGAICVAPIRIGEWALVGAGSVVTKSVNSFEYGFGNPYVKRGWIGKLGETLVQVESSNFWLCPISKQLYEEIHNGGSILLIEVER
jgi:acetyltransferase-like isoleucine patch superfamily enzyme